MPQQSTTGGRHLSALLSLACLLAWPACGADGPANEGDVTVVPDAAPVDAMELDSTVQDVGVDTAEPDTGPIEVALDCPGGQGCPCTENDGCDNNFCMDTPEGKRCAVTCISDCPGAFKCSQVSSPSGDVLTVCIPRWGFICAPCDQSGACEAALGAQGSACIDYGDELGAFCGSGCSADEDCPPEYACKDSQTVEGSKRKACVLKPDGSAGGVCPCSPRSRALELDTDCLAVSALGTCAGSRKCTSEGLSPCTAPEAVAEKCDGVDNDCNGQTDEDLCDDSNPCTDDACVSADGGCQSTANTATCDDDNACTSDDLCDETKCEGNKKDCDDGNPCTEDSCVPATGCSYLQTKKACDDANACTDNDLCDGSGACVGLAKDVTSACNDNLPCTQDGCDPKTGCQNEPKAGACEDGNPCTNGDTCEAGKCKPGTNLCDCTNDSDCAAQEDDNLCNGTLFCDKSKTPWFCKIDPKTVVTCADLKDVCKTEECAPKTGKCDAVNEAEGKPCNADDSICTAKDGCKAGTCTAGELIDCDDSNPCTDDGCDATKGCQPFDNIKGCDDGNKCTTGDTCASSICVPGKKLTCDDGSGCTFDFCDKATGKCVHDGKPHEGDPCDADGSVCTVSDTCVGGACTAGAAKPCDDGEACTKDGCDAKTGCQYINNSDPCEFDGNACTPNDKCVNGKCALGAAKSCDDDNTCTSDGCDAKTGKCQHAALDKKACDADGSLCTKGDICVGKECKAGAALNCDDGNQCTMDSCEKLKGCIHDVLNATPCSLQTACVKKELCIVGLCKGIEVKCDDDNVCTVDSCDPKTGCQFKPVADTSDCGGGKHCISGKCMVPGCGDGYIAKGEVCDDGNSAVCDGCESCQPRHNLLLKAGAWAGSAAASPTAGGLLGALSLEHDLTVEAWIRPEQLAGEQAIVSKSLKAGSELATWTLAIAAQGQLLFRHKSSEGAELVVAAAGGKSLAVQAKKWSHVAVVIAGERVRLFVNGAPGDSATLLKQRIDVSKAGVSVGRRFWDASGGEFTGAIDAVHIAAAALYGRAFQPSRRPIGHTRTAALWQMDEGAGKQVADSGPAGQGLQLNGGAAFAKDACFGAAADGAVCGDGKVSPAFEACDDGGDKACDGCEDCRVQKTWATGAGGGAIEAPPLSQWANDAFCGACDTTMEAWIRPDKAIGGAFEIVGSSCAMVSLMISQVPGGQVHFGVYRFPLPPLFSKTTVKPGKWYHVAATMGFYTGAEMRLFVNGKLEGSKVLNSPVNISGYNLSKEVLFIGAGTGGAGSGCVNQGATPKPTNHFIGELDEVRVSAGARYTGDFTPARRPVPDGQTRGLWHFDSAGGKPTDDSGQGVVTKVVAGSFANDACFGDLAASATCGDGQQAGWEVCDNGAANGALPNTCSVVCTANKPAKTPDCKAMSWPSGKLQMGKNVMSYPPAWTVEGWTRLNAYPAKGWGAIVGVDSTEACNSMPQSQRWYVGVGAEGLDATALGGANQTGSTAHRIWKLGIWQHFALQYHGAGMGSLYVDGALARTFSNGTGNWSASCPLLLGDSRDVSSHPLGAELAVLRLSKKVRYGESFAPATSLTDDADTIWQFEFDDVANGITQDGTSVYSLALDQAKAVAGGPGCVK